MGTKKIPFFDFSAVLDKLQAIADNVHPTASGTSITPTGMHIVTEDDVQGAISELDSAVDSVNSSLAQKRENVTSTHSDENIVFLKTGNNCEIILNGLKNISANAGTELCTIPTGFYPYVVGALRETVYNASLNPLLRFYVSNNRDKLMVYNYTSNVITIPNFSITCSYISE